MKMKTLILTQKRVAKKRMNSEDITSQDLAKKKLKILEQEYKDASDEVLKKLYELSIIRQQINDCLELISAFESATN